jgi:hypothetical protein
MERIKLTGVVDENGKLIVEGLSPGRVEITVVPLSEETPVEDAREIVRQKMRAERILAELHFPEAQELSSEERLRIGKLFADAGTRPLSEDVIADREDRV